MKTNTKISVPPPPPTKKITGKGAPPPVQEASTNLLKPMEGDSVAFNFRVPTEFRKQVRQYALQHDTTAVAIMMAALENYMKTSH